MYQWLKPTGYISHAIDFRCHGTAIEWNGHWSYSDVQWSLVRGRRPYLLNRQPHSVHVKLLQRQGFKIVCDIRTEAAAGVDRKRLAPRFSDVTDEDLVTAGAFIQAVPAAC